MLDHLGEDGCCLICVERGKCDKPCYQCKCRKCSWYSRDLKGCTYSLWKKEPVFFRLRSPHLEVVKRTKDAILLREREYSKAWFPLSQVVFHNKRIGIPRWLLEDEGWINPNDWDRLGSRTIEEYEKDKFDRKFVPQRKG